MTPVTLTDKRRAQLEAMFIDFAAIWKVPEFKEDQMRVVFAGHEALANLKKVELSLMERINYAMQNRDSIAMAAAVLGMQRDMLNTVYRGNSRGFAPGFGISNTAVDRALSVVTKNASDDLIDNDTTFGRNSKELMVFLNEKLTEMDAALEAQKALKAEEAEHENTAPTP